MKDQKDTQKELLKEVYERGRQDDAEHQIQTLGRDLVNRFFMLYRTAKVHTLENDATKKALASFIEVLKGLSDLLGRMNLTVVGDTFYLNKTMLKTDFSSFENFRFLGQLFAEYGFSGIVFNGVPDNEEVGNFLTAFLKSTQDEEDKSWIGNYASQTIQVLAGQDVEEVAGKIVSRDDLSDPGFLLRQYFKTIIVYRNVAESFKSGDVSALNILQRLVHEYVDAIEFSKKVMLKLASIHSTQDYVPFHSINVMILSLVMGKELGLSRRQISDLGTAALLHDIGKLRIPRNILEKKGKLLTHEWNELQQANTYSVLQLLKLRGFNESSLARLLVAHEHTRDLDPERKDRQPTLMARIVAIVRCYDAMVSPRSYRTPLLPYEALKIMKNQEKNRFDPVLLQVFINILTEYPPGSVLILNTKEIGLVVDCGSERSDPKKPTISIIYDKNGKKTKSSEVKLSKDPVRKVLRQIDPYAYDINVIPFLFPA